MSSFWGQRCELCLESLLAAIHRLTDDHKSGELRNFLNGKRIIFRSNSLDESRGCQCSVDDTKVVVVVVVW